MDCGVPVTGVALELHASREIVRHCERGANRALALRPPPRPPPRWLLERVDDADAVEIVEARQVFGVERLDAGFDTRSEDAGTCAGREVAVTLRVRTTWNAAIARAAPG